MSVTVTPTAIDGCFEVVFPRHADERGWFSRAFSLPDLSEHGVDFRVSQANTAYTAVAGTVRGMHYQLAPHGEQKFIRCIRGSVFDVLVDLRVGSPTFGAWHGTELSAENGKALLVPVGCAHGYQATSDDAQVVYFADTPYAAAAERVLSPRHRRVGIDWPVPITVISGKDDEADADAALEGSGY